MSTADHADPDLHSSYFAGRVFVQVAVELWNLRLNVRHVGTAYEEVLVPSSDVKIGTGNGSPMDDGVKMPTGKGSNMTLLEFLLTPKCYEELFINGNLLNLFCVQLLTSKLIGVAIILLSSVFMKLPQVLKLLSSRDSKGVSLLSQVLMLTTCSTNIGYSLAKDFPFSTWGESIAIGIQTLAICILILIYREDFKQAVLFTCVYFVGMVVILSPSTPLKVHTYLAMLAMPLNVGSRVAQIRLNYVSGGTGQLSALYIFLMNFRSVGRLYTNITETGDPIRIATFAVQCVMNWILATQILYYKGMIKIRPKLKKG